MKHLHRLTDCNRSRRGFVLLIVLLTLVVCSVSLASLTQLSLQRALDTLQAQDELQRRWAIVSCQRTLLPAARQLFQQREDARGVVSALPPMPFMLDSLMLGGQRVDLLLADEDAKVNLNSVYHAAGLMETERALRRLIGSTGLPAISMKPQAPSMTDERQPATARPDSESSGESPPLPSAFRSWGQVFDLTRLRQFDGDTRQMAGLTRQVTCWGTGRLNVRRAADDMVLTLSRSIVGDGVARRLLRRYRETPGFDIRLLIEQEVDNPVDRSQMTDLLGDASSSFSLWTEVASTRFRQQCFAVLQTDSEGSVRTFEFDW